MEVLEKEYERLKDIWRRRYFLMSSLINIIEKAARDRSSREVLRDFLSLPYGRRTIEVNALTYEVGATLMKSGLVRWFSLFDGTRFLMLKGVYKQNKVFEWRDLTYPWETNNGDELLKEQLKEVLYSEKARQLRADIAQYKEILKL